MTGVGTGALNIAGPDLPMEERETGEQLRARMEAKTQRSFSPWANRPTPPKHEERVHPVVAEAEERFVEPELREPEPALPEPTPAQVPVPASTAKPAPRPAAPARAARPAPDAAAIVQDYLDGQTAHAIAEARGHSTATVYRILRATPGVTLRDDRVGRSGSKKKTYDPSVVDAVRRLYIDEQLTQAQVAERLDLTAKVVQTIMTRHHIPARGDVIATGMTYNAPGRSTLASLTADMAAAGVTPEQLRAWARDNDIKVGKVGIPPRAVLNAYLDHRQAASSDLAPAPAPTPERFTCARCYAHVLAVSERAECDGCVADLEHRADPITAHSDAVLDEAADLLVTTIADVLVDDAPLAAQAGTGVAAASTAIRALAEALVTVIEAGLGYLDDELGAMAARIQNGAAVLASATVALDDLPAGEPTPSVEP